MRYKVLAFFLIISYLLFQIIAQATKLREDLLENIKSDNTTVADFTYSSKVFPCCDPNVFLCRCKKDEI